MGALTSSTVAADDQILASQYNNLRTDAGSHAARHITSGEDEVDGDQLDIDWDPSNYTPDSSPGEASDADDLTAHLKGIDDELPVTKEVFAAVSGHNGTFNTASFHNTTVSIDDGEFAAMILQVPHDFSSITDAVLVVVPASNANASWNVDIEVIYGANGEANNAHSDTDTGSTYDWSTDDLDIVEIDISGLLGNLAAGDYVNVEVENNETDDLGIYGVRLRYT